MSRKDKFNRSRMSRKDRFNSPKKKSEISISPDLVGLLSHQSHHLLCLLALPDLLATRGLPAARGLPDPHLTLIFVQKKMLHSLLLLLQIFKYRMVI